MLVGDQGETHGGECSAVLNGFGERSSVPHQDFDFSSTGASFMTHKTLRLTIPFVLLAAIACKKQDEPAATAGYQVGTPGAAGAPAAVPPPAPSQFERAGPRRSRALCRGCAAAHAARCFANRGWLEATRQRHGRQRGRRAEPRAANHAATE